MTGDTPARASYSIQDSVPDATLRSTPDTVLWGYIAANLTPALAVKPGAVVEIEALSHQGLTTQYDPEKFFAAYGIPAGDVLPDAKAVFSGVKRPKGASVHIHVGHGMAGAHAGSRALRTHRRQRSLPSPPWHAGNHGRLYR